VPADAYGGNENESTPWKDAKLEELGAAIGTENAPVQYSEADGAEELVTETEQAIADAAAEYPQLEGKTFIYGNLEPGGAEGVSIYTANDNRPRFLTELGMVQADVITENTEDTEEFFIPWSAERANELESDIFVTWILDEATKEAIADDALLGQIPAVESGALVADSDNTLTLSVSAANPLSLVWALDRFLPMLGEAADKV